jgi:hypothetical protein
VQVGQTVTEIVSIKNSFFVEGEIRPSDTASIRPSHTAVVKTFTYDFSILGGFEDEVH